MQTEKERQTHTRTLGDTGGQTYRDEQIDTTKNGQANGPRETHGLVLGCS